VKGYVTTGVPSGRVSKHVKGDFAAHAGAYAPCAAAKIDSPRGADDVLARAQNPVQNIYLTRGQQRQERPMSAMRGRP